MEGRPHDEKELIARSRAGDGRAFGDLVRAHQGLALRVAYLVVRDTYEAEDVTQEAFVKAYEAMERFREGEPFRPWILRIVRNEALNRVRGTMRRERLSKRLLGEPGSGDAAPSPESLAVVGDDQRAVVEAIDALSPKLKVVLVHRYLLGLDEREVASILELPVGTVKSRTSRGVSRLREILTAAGWEAT